MNEPSSPPPSRLPIAGWILVALVVATLAWTTFGLGGYLGETMAVTAPLTAVTLAVVLLVRRERAVHPAGWWTLPFLAYGAANVLWVAPMPWRGWQDWATWAHMAAIFWIVANGASHRIARGVVAVGIVALAFAAMVLACYQRFLQPTWLPLGRMQIEQFFGRASAPFGSPNSLAGLLVLVTPVAAALALRRAATVYERVIFGWVALLLVAGLALTVSRGGWLALTLALAAWPLVRGGWRWRRRNLLLALLLVLAMGAGAWAVVGTSTVAKQRAETFRRDAGERTRPVMWRAAWEIFKAQPWTGSGAGSYDVRFEPYRSETEQKNPQWAHNDYLNLLSDYGAVGAGLFALAAVGIARHARRPRERGRGRDSATTLAARDRRDLLESSWVRQGIGIGLVAFALHTFVDFHLKIPALAMIAAALAGLLVAGDTRAGASRAVAAPARTGTDDMEMANAADAARPATRFFRGLAAAGIVALAAGVAVPFYRAEGLRFAEREALEALGRRPFEAAAMQARAERALAEFTHALELDPRNGDAWADRAYAREILGHYRAAEERELGRAAEADARAALALSREVPEFWARLGVALDMQGRWLEAGEAFSEALRRAPVSAPLWFHQAYHLSLNRVTIPLARAAVATCLRLDPGNHQAEALRQRLPAGK